MRHTKGTQTRRAIIDAAIARFGRDGFRSTAVADIARDAGVGGTVAYAYFANKESLFLAALDEDAAGVIHDGVASLTEDPEFPGWRHTLILTLLSAVERHPLARRVLAGLEGDVTDRVMDIPALAELRKTVAERIRAEQLTGSVRPDIDPVAIGNGVVAITLSLLMTVIQVGQQAALSYGEDIAAVIEAALHLSPEVAHGRPAPEGARTERTADSL